MFKALRQWRAGKQKVQQDVQVRGRKLASAAQTLERYGEAAAFAEAGLQDVAGDIIQKEIQERQKILVVGNEESFSRPLVDYAVGFAKRMGYEIVALNCLPIGHEAPKILSPYQEELCKDFEHKAARGAELLVCRAAEEGIPCHHVIKFGSPDRCIREVHDETRRVEFVLTEPEAGPEGLEPAIPVFCLAK